MGLGSALCISFPLILCITLIFNFIITTYNLAILQNLIASSGEW